MNEVMTSRQIQRRLGQPLASFGVGSRWLAAVAASSKGPGISLGLGVLCFYFCAIMLLTIMLSEFTILERDYATYMLA